MSISPIVDTDYRLHPADLEGIARQVVIANVTYQGIEEMMPVLHFVGQTKRLVLSQVQVQQMLEITGTILYPRWIGIEVILQPPKARGEIDIKIKPVTAKQRGRPMPVYVSEDRRGWYLALTVVGLLLSTSILFAIVNIDTILLAVEQLRDNWPLR